MNIGIKLEQNQKHKISGRKKSNYEKGRALDITITIMNSILQKRRKGKVWKISKVSSFVHYPCFAIYNEKLKFEDKVLGEGSYTVTDDEGNTSIMEFEDSYMENGIYHLHR